MLVPNDDGLLFLLDGMRQWINDEPCKIKLYKNDYTPKQDGTDTVNDYLEADFGGYSEKTLNNLGTPVMKDGAAICLSPLLVWRRTSGSNTIYGYYVVDGNGNLLWAERRPSGPRTIDAATPEYALQARLRLRRDLTE
jgi:hypothetical protein